MHFHIAVPPGIETLLDAEQSNLASLRMRMAPAALAAVSLGWKMTINDNIDTGANILLIGKIGANDIDRRASEWNAKITEFLNLGKLVIVDYSDHHLETNGLQSPFYKEVLSKNLQIVVSNTTLSKTIQNLTKYSPWVIEDCIEYSYCEPKIFNERNNILWFGHNSNIKPLIASLKHEFISQNCSKLFLCTDTIGQEIIKQVFTANALDIDCHVLPWSRQHLLELSEISDFSFIPNDISSPKVYASSNRLITSLTLGLPVVATPIFSYREFKNYFTTFPTDFTSPITIDKLEMQNMTLMFQNETKQRFNKNKILLDWREALVNLSRQK